MSRRNQTNSDASPDWSLSQQQRTAIDLIVAGRNFQEVADAIGMQRSTISTWANHSAPFIAAVNARRTELWDAMVDELRSMLPQALAVLKKELQGEQPLPAAIQVLKSCGIPGAVGRPTGPVDPADADLALRQRASDRLMQELSVFASEP